MRFCHPFEIIDRRARAHQCAQHGPAGFAVCITSRWRTIPPLEPSLRSAGGQPVPGLLLVAPKLPRFRCECIRERFEGRRAGQQLLCAEWCALSSCTIRRSEYFRSKPTRRFRSSTGATTTAIQLKTGCQNARNRPSRINWLSLVDSLMHSAKRVRFPLALPSNPLSVNSFRLQRAVFMSSHVIREQRRDQTTLSILMPDHKMTKLYYP